MKKFLFLGLAAVIALASPVSHAADKRQDYVKRIETCEAILREFMADPEYAIPDEVLSRARALVIISQFKAGFIIGFTGGHGVIMAKRSDGTWSIPVIIDAGEASVGLQLGGQTLETIYVLTDEETPRRLFKGRVNVGVDAKAVVGPKFKEMETMNRDILATPVLVYNKAKGLFAGATVKAGFISRDDKANQQFYRTAFTLPELLYGNFVTPPEEVKPLMEYVSQIAP